MVAKKSASFDLNALDMAPVLDAPFEFEVVHPVNGPVGWFISVYSKESAAFQEFGRRLTNEQLARQIGKPEVATVEKYQDTETNALVACTAGWRGAPVVDGAPFDFTPDNARSIYARHGFEWLRQQVDENIGNTGNFMRR